MSKPLNRNWVIGAVFCSFAAIITSATYAIPEGGFMNWGILLEKALGFFILALILMGFFALFKKTRTKKTFCIILVVLGILVLLGT